MGGRDVGALGQVHGGSLDGSHFLEFFSPCNFHRDGVKMEIGGFLFYCFIVLIISVLFNLSINCFSSVFIHPCFHSSATPAGLLDEPKLG